MFHSRANESGAAGRSEMLREVAAVVGAANRPADLARVREVLISAREPLLAFPLALGLGDGLRQAGSSFEKAGVHLEPLLARGASLATDKTTPESARGEAI